MEVSIKGHFIIKAILANEWWVNVGVFFGVFLVIILWKYKKKQISCELGVYNLKMLLSSKVMSMMPLFSSFKRMLPFSIVIYSSLFL